MADARRLYPDFDITRSWALPAVPVKPDDESLEAYLRRVGFTEAQLQYTRRSWGNATGEAIHLLSATASLQDMGLLPVQADPFYGEPLPKTGDGDYRIADGYDLLHKALAEGVDVRLNTVAEAVEWGARPVRVRARSGDVFEADRVVITLPLGVLQAGSVRFSPDLPDWKRNAISALRMGPALKLVYRFREPILPQGIYAYYSPLNPPMWWSPTLGEGENQVWMAFATGDWARELLALGEEGALQKGLETLRTELDRPNLEADAMHLVNWVADEFSLGGYSAVPAGAAGAHEVLAKPVGEVLFFAGEAAAPNPWSATVHGAYMSGRRAAHEILSEM
jgi:monoamine oxidase